MELEKSEIKILQYVNRHKKLTYTKAFKKFPKFKDCYHMLNSNHYIKSEDPNDNLYGNEYDDLNNPTIIEIDRKGEIFLQSHKWLNWRFIVKEFLCPFVVSVITTLVTLILTGELKLW